MIFPFLWQRRHANYARRLAIEPGAFVTSDWWPSALVVTDPQRNDGKMLIQEVIEIPTPLHDVRALILGDPHAALDETLSGAYADAERLCRPRAPSRQPAFHDIRVLVDTGEPYPRGEGIVIPVRSWALDATNYFPRLDADLEVMPVGPAVTRIRLMGRFDLPSGDAAADLSRPLLQELAETSIRSFLNRLGEVVQRYAGLVRSTESC